MRGFVDKLRARITPSSVAKGPGVAVGAIALREEPIPERAEVVAEATHLSQELLRLYQAGAIEQAAEVAHRLVVIKLESFGDRHLEYAAALCHHALLLQGLGKLDKAEAGLREVLDIRHEALGMNHPSVAMTLSQLAMLLVESRQWDEAESALTESLSMRRELLGENHPSLAADLKVLEMLTQRRAEVRATPRIPTVAISAPTAASAPRSERLEITVAEPGVAFATEAAPPVPTLSRDPKRIQTEMQSLAGALTRIGAGMTANGQRMMTQGLPPNPRLLSEATACHRHFASLCDEAIRRAEELELDLSPFMGQGQDRFSLADLTLLFDEIFRHENDSAKHQLARKTTLAMISRILELTHDDPRKNATLQPVHELAETLQTQVRQSPLGRAPAEAHAVVEGSHPLVALDRLIMADDELDDETWIKLYDTLADSQGKRLAAAAARKRLKPQRPFASPQPGNAAAAASASSPAQRVTDVMDSLLDDEDFMPARPGRDASAKRIIIPDATTLLNRPRLGSAPPSPNPTPRHAAPTTVAPPTPTPPPATSQRIDSEPARLSPSSRSAKQEKDLYDFLRTQTSIISQR